MIRGVAKSGLFFVLALLSQGAQSSPLEECLENSTNEMEIRQCLAAVYAKADKDLNAVYRESLKNAKQISSETHTNLIASERAWIRLRDAECNFQASWEQGSLGARARMWCLAETTISRVEYLKQYAKRKVAMPTPNATRPTRKISMSKGFSGNGSRAQWLADEVYRGRGPKLTKEDFLRSKVFKGHIFSNDPSGEDELYFVTAGNRSFVVFRMGQEGGHVEFVQSFYSDRPTMTIASSASFGFGDLLVWQGGKQKRYRWGYDDAWGHGAYCKLPNNPQPDDWCAASNPPGPRIRSGLPTIR